MTVPYAPLFDDIRENHGFVDTRGRPDLALGIPEVAQSRAMKDMLLKLSEPSSKIFSVGCDLGKKYVTDEGTPYHRAGGYVQIMSKNYPRHTPREYAAYSEVVAELLLSWSCNHEWILNIVVTPVQFNLDEFRNMTGSFWIWFHAFGDTEEWALASREEYIAKLGACILDDSSLACIE